jgi:hypothetical protein
MTSLQLAKYTGSSSSSYNIYTHIHSPTNIIIALPLAQPTQLYKSNFMTKASIMISAMGWNHWCKNIFSVAFIQQGYQSSGLKIYRDVRIEWRWKLQQRTCKLRGLSNTHLHHNSLSCLIKKNSLSCNTCKFYMFLNTLYATQYI